MNCALCVMRSLSTLVRMGLGAIQYLSDVPLPGLRASHFSGTGGLMPLDAIVVSGAREHNLKNIDVTIPRDQLVVITGLSGSGKSSLAFDTIYAEGQRRYVESLSAYARQFLGQMEKPDVDYIEGLSPAISIDQKGASRNPRSTVGTVTEIYDYLRLLFARAGTPALPQLRPADRAADGAADRRRDPRHAGRQAADDPRAGHPGPQGRAQRRLRGRAARRLRARARRRRASATSKRRSPSTRNKSHTIEVVVDRLITEDRRQRIERRVASRRAAAGDSTLRHQPPRRLGRDGAEARRRRRSASTSRARTSGCTRSTSACPFDGISFGELAPRNFSFNSPHGACPDCTGLGVKMEIDPELVIPNKNLSIAEGAIVPWARAAATQHLVHPHARGASAKKHGFTLDVPVSELTQEQLERRPVRRRRARSRSAIDGRGGHTNSWDTKFEGVITNLTRRYKETDSDYIRSEIERYMAAVPCPTCRARA